MVSAFADEAMQVMVSEESNTKSAMQELVQKYAKELNLSEKKIDKLARQSVEEFQEMAEVLASDISNSFVQQLTKAAEKPDTESQTKRDEPQPERKDGLGQTQILDGTGSGTFTTETEELLGTPTTPENAETLLMDGLQEVTGMLVGEHNVSEIFNVVLETMYRAVGFQRVVLALLDRKRGRVVGRLSFGDVDDAFLEGFSFSTTYNVDVFHGALKNAVDVYIADATDAKIQADIPDWYKKISAAGSFLLFPLVINKHPVGLIYADHASPRGLEIDNKRLNLLKSLRNQIVLAVR